MALIKCPHCSKDMADASAICPNCGQQISSHEPKPLAIISNQPKWIYKLKSLIDKHLTLAIFIMIYLIASVSVTIIFLMRNNHNTSRVQVTVPGISVSPLGNIFTNSQSDEVYFLLRYVSHLQMKFPEAAGNDYKSQFTKYRQRLLDILDYVITSNYDTELIDIYKLLIQTVDAINIAYLNNANAVESLQPTSEDQVLSAVQGCQAYQGGLLSIVSYVAESSKRQKAHDKQLQSATDIMQATITSASQDFRSAFIRKAKVLEKRYSWQEGESCSNDNSYLGRRKELLQSKDYRTLARLADCDAKLRPRDPFILIYGVATKWALSEYHVDNSNLKEYFEYAHICERAFGLIPDKPIYDIVKQEMLDFAVLCYGLVYCERDFSDSIKQDTDKCINTCSLAIKLGLGDINIYKMITASAYGHKGIFDKGIEEVNSVDQTFNDMASKYELLARLYSLNGDPIKAWKYYLLAIADPKWDKYQYAMESKDLKYMRDKCSKEFADALTIKYTWKPVWGIIQDGIDLYNNSAFSLTNVKYDISLWNNGKEYSATLYADKIPKGGKQEWRSVFSVTDSKYDRYEEHLSCNESH